MKGGPGHRDDYLRAAVLEIVYKCSYNNIVEQDHRAIKRRCSATHGLEAFERAAVMISGLELAHRIRKRQFTLGRARGRCRHTMKTAWDRALFGF